MKLKLSSADECQNGTTLDTANLWTRLNTTSPIPAVQGAAPSETARHNASARMHRRDSQDSVPVLPQTAERRRQMHAAAADVAAGGACATGSPKRQMRRGLLDYAEAACPMSARRESLTSSGVVGNGAPLMARRDSMLTPLANGVIVRIMRRDSLTPSVGCRAAPTNKTEGINAMVSPAAASLAAELLGGLYNGSPAPLAADMDLRRVASPRAW